MRSAVINYNWISHLHSSWDWVISQHRHVLINACIGTSMSLSTQHVSVSCSCYCLSFHSHAGFTAVVRIPVGFWNSFWKCSFIDPPVFCFWFQSSWIRCIRLGIFMVIISQFWLSVECLLCSLILLTHLILLVSFVSPPPSACFRLFWTKCFHVLTSPVCSWGETFWLIS